MQRERDLLLPWRLSLHRPPDLFQSPNDPALEEAWQALREVFPAAPRLDGISEVCRKGRIQLAHLQTRLQAGTGEQVRAALTWCAELKEKLTSAEIRANALLAGFEQLGREAEAYVREMDFTFLFNSQRQVFHIGYNLETGQLDQNFYDLLASEARIASLVAIATNQVPQRHWLHLGRPFSQLPEGLALLSWSGTMFEYLMPALLNYKYEGTLLHESMVTATDYQIAYGRQ
jgi:cyclic beta-1,2-glucan synthetase